MKDAGGHGSDDGGGAGARQAFHDHAWKNLDALRYFSKPTSQGADQKATQRAAFHDNAMKNLGAMLRSPTNEHAASVLASGPKSRTVPTHDSMTAPQRPAATPFGHRKGIPS